VHRSGSNLLFIVYVLAAGGGACLWTAAQLGSRVSAVVVRGGRPDLAAEALPAVAAPTLLMVGGADVRVLELNQSGPRPSWALGMSVAWWWCLAPAICSRGLVSWRRLLIRQRSGSATHGDVDK